MKVDLGKYNNDWYSVGKSSFTQFLWYFINSVILNSYFIPISSLKVFLLKRFGATIGKNVVIKPKVNIKYPWKLQIGDNTWIGENVWIDNLDNVSIGKNCCLSQGSMILCGNHDYSKSSFDLIVKPVIMEDGSWLGAQSIACPGVKLKSNSILSVGSIATTDLINNGIYKGNPAVKIKDRVIND